MYYSFIEVFFFTYLFEKIESLSDRTGSLGPKESGWNYSISRAEINVNRSLNESPCLASCRQRIWQQGAVCSSGGVFRSLRCNSMSEILPGTLLLYSGAEPIHIKNDKSNLSPPFNEEIKAITRQPEGEEEVEKSTPPRFCFGVIDHLEPPMTLSVVRGVIVADRTTLFSVRTCAAQGFFLWKRLF